MSDLQARVVAALHEVRTSTPRPCDEYCDDGGPLPSPRWHSAGCNERWAARVNARLAACVEAGFLAVAELVMEADVPIGHEVALQKMYAAADKAGLAAFLAAAAQKETT
jgi:hypothetical protein